MTSEALLQMERFATRCNGGNPDAPGARSKDGHCKSCSFMLTLIAEVRRLQEAETSHTTFYGVATETRT